MSNFYDKIYPVAKYVADARGLYPSVIMALTALESAKGTSKLARESNNYAGISDMDGRINSWSKADGMVDRPKDEGAYYTRYTDIMDFASDLATVFGFSYYKAVRNATTPEAQIRAIGDSPYAVDPNHGDKILAIWKQDNLSRYDGGNVTVVNTDTVGEAKVNGYSDEQLIKIGASVIGLLALIGIAKGD